MEFFEFDAALEELSAETISECSLIFRKINEIAYYNQQKVLAAFTKNGVSASHLGISTGYGYDDSGRDMLERVFADCMGAEDALIRHNFVSGTHTLTVALFGLLRPNDEMLCVTGRPYDTLIGVLGIDKKTDGSLLDFGIKYNQVDLKANGEPDLDGISIALTQKKYKMVYIQRSKGYSLRPSLSVEKIAEICRIVKKMSPDTIIMVDNCYGEFVQKNEPCEVGADIIAGSLIKNPGGGIAPTGGYIAGRRDLVEKCSYRLTAPGVGKEVGATLGHLRELYMGLFAAPHTVGEALKTAVFAAKLFGKLGYEVSPNFDEPRADIIQTISLKSTDRLIAFCQGLQKGSPIDSLALPYPAPMPGYDNEVIMAAGAFTLGASIELSADAPLREPYAVWLQGGLNFASGQIGILSAAKEVINLEKDKN